MTNLNEINAIVFGNQKYTLGENGETPENLIDLNNINTEPSFNNSGALNGLEIDLGVYPSKLPDVNDRGFYIKKISSGILANMGIPHIELPSKLEVIESPTSSRLDGAFENNALTSIVLPDTLREIGNSAFRNNQITSVTIPDGVTSIGDYAFANNPLTEVSIGPNTTYQSNSFPSSAVITARVDDIHGLPGPKSLQYKQVESDGTITGYFGEVSEEEVGIGVAEAMKSMNGFVGGSRRYPRYPDKTPLWHKFLNNGRILYISNFTPYRWIKKWNEIESTSQTQIIPNKPDLSITIMNAPSSHVELLRYISEFGRKFGREERWSWGINIPFHELNTHDYIAGSHDHYYPYYIDIFKSDLTYRTDISVRYGRDSVDSGEYGHYVALEVNDLPAITEDD